VVGAGHNGLAATVHLAGKGWKVAVLEGKSEPGGAVASGKASGVRLANDSCSTVLQTISRGSGHSDMAMLAITARLAVKPWPVLAADPDEEEDQDEEDEELG
jgi:phytoene dehydrogenase-like protein